MYTDALTPEDDSIGKQALWDVLLPPQRNCWERNLSAYEGDLRGLTMSRGSTNSAVCKSEEDLHQNANPTSTLILDFP